MDHAACWCGQLRGCAVFGFRLRVTVRRAPCTRRASTDLDMRAVYAYVPNTVHGLQYSKLTTTIATPCNAVIHTTARVSADQYQVRSLSVATQGGRRRTSCAAPLRLRICRIHFTRPAGTVSYCSVHGLRRGATRPRHATEGDTIQQVQACLHSAGVQYSSNGAATDAASIAFSMVPRSSQGDRRSVVSRFSRDGVEVVRRTSLRVKVRRPLLVEMNLLISA